MVNCLLICEKCEKDIKLEFENLPLKCKGAKMLPCGCGGWLTYQGAA
jgi:hypothetical protein